jgi:hypothetical protein
MFEFMWENVLNKIINHNQVQCCDQSCNTNINEILSKFRPIVLRNHSLHTVT